MPRSGCRAGSPASLRAPPLRPARPVCQSTYQSTWPTPERTPCTVPRTLSKRVDIVSLSYPNADERTHRHRQPPPVRQGRRGLGGCAPGARGARPHRPALRRRALPHLLRRARSSHDPIIISTSAGHQHRADRAHAGGARAAARGGAAGRAARLRRHELDARRRPCGRAARRSGGARRGRHALVDRTMPEELNRVLADHASSLLLCSSERAAETLRGERVAGEVVVVGDVMVDVAQLLAPRARERTEPLAAAGVEPGGYVLATAHRPGNVDDPARLALLVELLLAVPGAGRAAAAPAHARAAGGRRPARAAGAGVRLVAAARLPRLHGAAPALPRRLTDSGACRRRPTWRACRA